ncbi:hypothetical protein KC887_07505 [Candidatus Kaiserbacteria bacterium]|nr:hypothetical protein [Candidatus Kaiserbacteria bacterium]
MLQYGVLIIFSILLLIEGGFAKIHIIAGNVPAAGARVEWVEGPCGDRPDEITIADENGNTKMYMDRGDKFCATAEWTDALGRIYSGDMRIKEADEYKLILQQQNIVTFIPIAR